MLHSRRENRAEIRLSSAKGDQRLFYTAIAIAGIVLYVVLDAIVQSLPPHYSPISQAESDLAVGPFGYIMSINFLNRGLLSLVFILGLVRTIGPRVRSEYRTGVLLLGVWAAGAILLAVFPTDVPATPVSPHGEIHLVVAVMAFLGGAFGALSLSRKLVRNQEFPGTMRLALSLSVFSVIFCLIQLGLPFVTPHFVATFGGLIERLFLGSLLLWVGVVSAYMIKHIKRTAPAQPKI